MTPSIKAIAAVTGVACIVLIGWAFSPKPLPSKKVTPAATDRIETAVFAGGCFWCMEPPFESIDGVFDAESGYTGGHVEFPSYKQVCQGDTGHVEAVRITYDPDRVRYEDLLEVFWRQIDPTDDGGQFVDRGASYVSAIFAQSDDQRQLAESSKQSLAISGRFDDPIITPVLDSATFYPAEDYHQDYYLKSTLKYKYYRYRSGRDAFLDKAWGDDRNYAVPSKLDDPASEDAEFENTEQADPDSATSVPPS